MSFYTYREGKYKVIYNKKTGAVTIDFDDLNKANVNYPATHQAAKNAKQKYEESLKDKPVTKKAPENKKTEAEKKALGKKKVDAEKKPAAAAAAKKAANAKVKKTMKQKFQEWKESPAGTVATPLLGLMGLDVALQSSRYFFSPTVREAKRQLAILEEKRRKGTLGQDRALEAFQRQQLMRPIRAIAEQQEREQQATMAGMGESLQPYRQELQRQQSKQSQIQGAVQAQQYANQAAAARKQEEEGRRLALLQTLDMEKNKIYKGLKSGAASVARQLGTVRAAEAQVKPAQEHGEIVEELKKIYPDMKDKPEMLRQTALRIQEGKSKENMAKTLGKLNYNDSDFTKQLVKTFTGME